MLGRLLINAHESCNQQCQCNSPESIDSISGKNYTSDQECVAGGYRTSIFVCSQLSEVQFQRADLETPFIDSVVSVIR